MTNEMPVSLSPKEKQVIHSLYVEGKTEKQTAKIVAICHTRVKQIKAQVREKCGLDSNKQILYFLTKNNLI